MAQQSRSVADKFERLDKSRRLAIKLETLMDPEVQEYFSSHEAVLIGKTVDLASNGDADQLRSAALDLKSWRDMREFVRGVATSLPRINDSLEDMRQRAESSP